MNKKKPIYSLYSYSFYRFILDSENTLADLCCMLLSNVTRPENLVDRVVNLMEKANYNWDKIVHAFAYASTYNKKGENLHYLGPVLSNLSQSKIVRTFVFIFNHFK